MKCANIEDPEGFNEFWSLWKSHQRGTDGRGKARPTYTKLMLNGAEPQDILDGAKWFLRNLKERDREFIPLASSWLNSERWADDCELERAFQAKQSQRAVEPSNVTPIRPALPKTHFMNRWNNGEIEAAS